MNTKPLSMSTGDIIQKLLDKYIKQYGYVPTQEELMSLYSQGELQLTDKEENILASIKGGL